MHNLDCSVAARVINLVCLETRMLTDGTLVCVGAAWLLGRTLSPTTLSSNPSSPHRNPAGDPRPEQSLHLKKRKHSLLTLMLLVAK